MDSIPIDIKIDFLKFLEIDSFIKMSLLNKDFLEIGKEYLRFKKLGTHKKTINNCLYKLDNKIVKIIKICDDRRNKGKKEITYYVTGLIIYDRYGMYPEWCTIEAIDPDCLMQFY